MVGIYQRKPLGVHARTSVYRETGNTNVSSEISYCGGKEGIRKRTYLLKYSNDSATCQSRTCADLYAINVQA